jgi:hypothetical protein
MKMIKIYFSETTNTTVHKWSLWCLEALTFLCEKKSKTAAASPTICWFFSKNMQIKTDFYTQKKLQ